MSAPIVLMIGGADLRRIVYEHFETREAILLSQPIYLAHCRQCERLFVIDRPVDDAGDVSSTSLRQALDHFDKHAAPQAETVPEIAAAERAP